ncbi:hypothetical protein M413DRAFT_387066 [Hebeloma cylindrosporum]|uniref:HMG box domain-containing protein n=1 Tax=Hebeloma cylindrosporum TaxID=76867 RepID=A0A0C3C4C2_HEBCY|nr:hypothetical protein M413DRAFT_387066 [Hebeloma cylindrosporum h7]
MFGPRALPGLTCTSDEFDPHFHPLLVTYMFIPLLRTPLARYGPLNASSQLTRRAFPVSAGLTRSFAAATGTKAKKAQPAKAEKAKPGKEAKVDGRKRYTSSLPRPKRPLNAFLRFASHYRQSEQGAALSVADIAVVYNNLGPEEKEKFHPSEQETEAYKEKRAEWEKKNEEAKFKAKRSGYQLFVSETFPKSGGFEESSNAMKDVATNWQSLTVEEKAEWSKRAADQYEERNRS